MAQEWVWEGEWEQDMPQVWHQIWQDLDMACQEVFLLLDMDHMLDMDMVLMDIDIKLFNN
jgi:hypothetical protein